MTKNSQKIESIRGVQTSVGLVWRNDDWVSPYQLGVNNMRKRARTFHSEMRNSFIFRMSVIKDSHSNAIYFSGVHMFACVFSNRVSHSKFISRSVLGFVLAFSFHLLLFFLQFFTQSPNIDSTFCLHSRLFQHSNSFQLYRIVFTVLCFSRT